MEPPRPGLGLFTRPGPRPTSIAVHLGLVAPQPERPWAVRVSTPLAHPAADGLARHVGEIERLAAVGKSVVAHLAPAVFAAAVTVDAVRTWLLYAATDRTPPLDGLTVTAAADPTWDAYRSLLPTAGEADRLARQQAEFDAAAAARAATQATVRHLRATGVDLTRPAAVRYAVAIPPAAAAAFADRATATGLRPAGDGWFVRDDLPDLALIARTERWLIHEAACAGGRYDGWTVAA